MARVATGGRPCSACNHPDRNEIDRQLLNPNVTMTEIGRIYNIHPRNLCRHRNTHLSKLLRSEAALEVVAAEAERGASLIDQVATMRDRAIQILNKAESTKNHDTALRAVREARSCIELMGKLDGVIREGTVINNVFNGPAWVTLQTNLMAALLPFPDAREAVLAALAPAANG